MSFPQERYERIEQLVKSYKNKDQDAAIDLIELFRPLFNKYLRIIKFGGIDLSDLDTRSFISLFIQDPKIKHVIRRSARSQKVRDAATRVADFINKSFSNISEEDLAQDFSLILLHLATEYKDGSFASYVGTAFKFEVWRFVSEILKNPLNSGSIIEFDEESLEKNGYSYVSSDETTLENDELGPNWVCGITCDDIFMDLEPLERLILKLYYSDNLSDTEIGKQTGYHRNWIGIKRRAAVEKLRNRMNG